MKREKNGEYSKDTLSFYLPAAKAMSCPSIKAIIKTSAYADVAWRCAEDAHISDSIYEAIL